MMLAFGNMLPLGSETLAKLSNSSLQHVSGLIKNTASWISKIPEGFSSVEL